MEIEIWQLALSTVASISGLILAANQFERFSHKSKRSLKSDIELLKSINPENPNYQVISDSVKRSVIELYKEKEVEFANIRFYYGICGLIICGLFTLWIYASFAGLDWYFYIKGYFAVFGFFLAFYAIFIPNKIQNVYQRLSTNSTET